MILYKNTVHHITCKCFILVLVYLYVGTDQVVAQFGLSLYSTPLNCSRYCTCQQQDIQNVIHHHYQNHNSFSGSRYEDGLSAYSKFKYMDFLGFYSLVVGSMIEISCHVGDGRTHTVSSLLNGIDSEKYASLIVKCRSGESLIWDIPPWQVYFNIFESKKCSLIPDKAFTDVIIPMNMWIFNVRNVGDNLIYQIDTKYTINTMVLSIEGTDTFTIPDKWAGDAMISMERLNLQHNKLKRMECKIQFTKNLDTINLSNNELIKFPDCLMEDKLNIHFLSLAKNDISDISCLYRENLLGGRIEIIDLSFNSIEKIGNFKPMNGLFVLDLSDNEISEINDDAFNKLTDLKQLYLQNNRIHFIGPVAFRENINLGIIRLSSNLIKHVRSEQFPATNTKLQIDLRKNKFRLPPFINEMKRKHFLPPNLSVMSVFNPFHCDCHMLTFDEYVHLMDNGTVNTTTAKDFFPDVNQLKCLSPRTNKGKTISGISFVNSCLVFEDCPQNCQCTLLKKSVFVVNCTARRLLELPENIPLYPSQRVIVDMSRNPLQILGYRYYLSNISELYVDNCLLTSVTQDAIEALQNVEVLRLHNNLLHKLPTNTKNITLRRANNVTLHNNRWSCSCDNLWLPQWISTHRGVLWKPGSILCNYLQKPLEDFSPRDVNCEGYSSTYIIWAVTLILASLMSSIFILFFFSKDIKLLLYTKLGIRLSTDFSYGDQFSPYDAFVSYGQDSYKWVVDTLVPHLEDGPKKYRLCLHYRDFPPAESNVENVPWAIRLSKSSILVLSKEFMKKEWCILELRSAFQRLLMAANKLIIVVTDDVSPGELTPDLRAYMNTHEYLRADEPLFWERLELFLPHKEPRETLPPPPPPPVNIHEGSGDMVLGTVTDDDNLADPHQVKGESSFNSLKNGDALNEVGSYVSNGRF